MFLEDLFRRGTTLARFRLPPLGPKMDEFSEWLRAQRFSRHVMRRRIWQVSHFNQYLRRQGVRACQEVEKSHAERFIIRHLPRCRCGGRRGIKHVGASSSVRSFIDFLSERGLVSVASPSPPSYQKLLQEYLDYLKCERNLAERTLKALLHFDDKELGLVRKWRRAMRNGSSSGIFRGAAAGDDVGLNTSVRRARSALS